MISLPSLMLAAPTQQDVFRSIQDNVGRTTDPTKFLAFLFGTAGLIIVIALLNTRRNRQVKPKILNHQGKLLKEIARDVDLRSAEIKQLKLLAEKQGVSSPLTLLLCPSVLTQAVKENAAKVDKKIILGIARKLN